MKKPSERIMEILKAEKILDGQDPESPNFESMSFAEIAIMQYLDEIQLGTKLEIRTNKKP